jgi:translocation and assembly module TamB
MKAILRRTVWTIAIVAVLLVALLFAAAFYTTTADFQRRVNKQVVSILEDATGGHVELAHIRFSLWHLAIEAGGLVIHGLEGPGEQPYLAADRILVRVKIVSLLQHTAGGAASHIGLNLLRVEQPRIHLIIDKDGKTNQPVPKHHAQSDRSTLDTLLDLKAHEVELVNGVALLNDRAIPFTLAARDLQAQVQYLPATDRYTATIDLSDLRTRMLQQPEAQSQLHVEAEVGRDMASLKNLTLQTSSTSAPKALPTTFTATASLTHFAHPDWQVQLNGAIAMRQITILTGVEGFSGGAVELAINGHNCHTSPAVAQRHPRFWDRVHPPRANPSAKVLPPDPDCPAGYLVVGTARLHNANYEIPNVHVYGVNGSATLHVTPAELLFTAITAELQEGGVIRGQMKIVNWLGEAGADSSPQSATLQGAITTANKTSAIVSSRGAALTMPKAPPVVSARTYITVTVNRVPLRSIMHIVAVKGYGDLGFDTAITGPVEVDWGGPVADIASAVQVQADLQLHPVGDHRGRSNIPIDGHILGHYDDASHTVAVTQLSLATPQSTLQASGILGVAQGGPLTALHTDLTLRDFAEYDQLLTTLDLEGNGRRGAAAIPVILHGSATFHGTATGDISRIDVKGHVEASNVELRLDPPPTPAPAASNAPPNMLTALLQSTPPPPPPAPKPILDVLIDSIVADADYTPQGLSVATSTVRRKTAILHLSGSFLPHTVALKRTTDYVWDDSTIVNLKVQLASSDVVDLLQIAGEQQNVQLTGTVALDASAQGMLRSLSGGGTLALANGAAYGEPYDVIDVIANVAGQQIEAPKISLRVHGDQIDANGGYNYSTKQLHAHLNASNLLLSKFASVRRANLNADGTLSITADAKGTLTEPNLAAHLALGGVTIEGKPVGSAIAEAHSQGKLLFYTAHSTLVGSQVDASGQTDLTGDLQTKAQLSIGKLDVGVGLALFEPGVKATSNVSGSVSLAGPLRTPRALTGSAAFDHFEFTSQGITLQAAEPLRIGLENGLATLSQVHITGTDTDLRATGTAQLFSAVRPGQPDPNAGKLSIQALGSVSMALAHTFDPELTASGKVVFTVGLGGQIARPQLSGKVDFQAVNLAIDGIANGLSNMNGTLVFNEDRLNIQSLTASTGGGQVKISGFLSYNGGLYADLTANAAAVRVRYSGISGTADSTLRLQGSGQTARLSGSMLVTRFGIGADVDFSSFAAPGGVSSPSNPNAIANRIALDVRVTSAPGLDFQNSYAKLAGTVDLTLRGTIAEPTILGRIQITDGNATFAGTKYQLQRGDIYFTNPVRIDPNIDLDATARVENYDITIGLQGTSSSLKPTYRSSPPLSEADIFNLLAIGRTQEEAQIYQEQQTQSGTDPMTSALLGGALNATVSNRVSKLFGGGSVKIDPAFVGTLGTSSARITVQQQLSRQLTLTYATNVGYSSEQLISIQYDLTPTMSIVATRDESDVFSLVYKIRRRYR